MFQRVSAALFLGILAARLLASDVTPVGRYGDLNALEIRGAKTFTPEAIRSELSNKLELRLAAHPLNDAAKFVDELRRQVIAGYGHAGFPDPQLRSEPNDGRLVLTIDEGRRYHTGAIRVEGAKTLSVEQLLARLTAPYPPKDALPQTFVERDGVRQTRWADLNGKEVQLSPAVWPRDGWAKFPVTRPRTEQGYVPPEFVRPLLSTLHEPIREALADIGYYFPKFDVSVTPDAITGKAELRIHILDEGPTAEIGTIEIGGNQRNSREEILDYLKIKPGDQLTRQRLVELQQQLWAAARFLRSEVKPILPMTRTDKLILRIELVECTKAPKLSERLSAQEQTMLRCRDWLANRQNWKGDLVWMFHYPKGEMCLIVAKDAGAFASFRDSLSADDDLRLDSVIFSSGGETIAMSKARRAMLRFGPPKGTVFFGPSLQVSENPKDENTFRLAFPFGMTPEKSAAEEPITITLTLQPTVFLALSRDEDGQFSNRILTLTTRRNGVWRIVADTGELLDIVYENRDGEDPNTRPAKSRLAFQPGAFRAAAAQPRQEAAKYENQFDSARPLSSVMGFLCDEPFIAKAVNDHFQDVRPLRTFNKLLGLGTFSPLDEWIRQTAQDESEAFKIPAIPGSGFEDSHNDPRAFAMLALAFGDRLVPHDSWCWSLMNESAMVVLGHRAHTDQVLRQLCDDTAGPLRLAAVAAALQRVNVQMAGQVAARGLGRLSLERFKKDCQPLLDEKYLVGQCLRRAATVFGNLSDDDIRLLSEGVDGRYHKYLAACDKALRHERDRPITKSLDALIDQLWQAGLKDDLELLLTQLRGPTGGKVDEGTAIDE